MRYTIETRVDHQTALHIGHEQVDEFAKKEITRELAEALLPFCQIDKTSPEQVPPPTQIGGVYHPAHDTLFRAEVMVISVEQWQEVKKIIQELTVESQTARLLAHRIVHILANE